MTKFLYILSLLAFFVSPSSCNPPTSQLIGRVCRYTLDPKYCTETLSSNIKSPNTNLVDLTKLTSKIALDFGRHMVGYIYDRGQTVVKNPKDFQTNAECEKAYRRVLRSLGNANSAAYRGDFGSMVVELLGCGGPISFCESRIRDSDFQKENRKMKVLISAALYEKSQMG